MLFKILHGDASRISTEITPFHEGYCYVTHDGYMYVDMNVGTVEAPDNQRIKLNASNAETLTGMTLEEIKEYVDNAINELNDKINDITGENSILGTWVFNDEVAIPEELWGDEYYFGYFIDEYAMSSVYFWDDGGGFSLYGDDIGFEEPYIVGDGWFEGMSKTITITEEPTDQTFIAWLKANAVKQPNEYQLKTDYSLETNDKTIAGAINELNKTSNALVGPYSEGLAYTLKDNDEYEVTGIGTCTDTDVVIPSIYNGKRVTSIGDDAFKNCSALTNITIPDSVTSIGSSVFRGCENLTSIFIPSSITSIGDYAFYDCSSLISIVIPKTITNIGNYVFSNCINLTIYCETKSHPEEWGAYWRGNFSGSTIWGTVLDFISVNDKLSNLASKDKTIANAINELNDKTVDRITSYNFGSGTISDANFDEHGITWFNEQTEIEVEHSDGNFSYFNSASCNNKVPIVAGEGISFNTDIHDGNRIVRINNNLLKFVTYSELKSLRDNSELIPGMFYRITDYVCTTSQADTRAMDNKFDIIIQALSENTLSENASADYHYDEEGAPDGYFMVGVEGGLNMDIHCHYKLVIGTYEGNNNIVEFGTATNNDGETVPVLYHDNDGEVNYDDKWFYVGTYEFEDETFDRWRLIEIGTAEDGAHTWDSTEKKFVLTNVVVQNNTMTITDISELEIAYTIYDDTEGAYEGSEEGLIGKDKIVDCGYKENNKGVVVPVLYKTDIENFADEIDYGDTMYYVDQYEYKGQTYDRWRKIEDNGFGWDDEKQHYILTDIIVEDNQFIDGVINENGGTPVKNANLSAWELKYCLDNDTTRFAWASPICITNLSTANSNGAVLVRKPELDKYRDDDIYPCAWATDSDVELMGDGFYIYSANETIVDGEEVYNQGTGAKEVARVSEHGKGVIHYMKDEHGNECPYDFKNIQFKRYMITETEHESISDLVGHYFGIPDGNDYAIDENDYIWCYTFTGCDTSDSLSEVEYYDMSTNPHKLSDQTIQDNEDNASGNDIIDNCRDNIIKPLTEEQYIDDIYYIGRTVLNNIVLYGNFFDNGSDNGCRTAFCTSNIFGNDCTSNTFGNNCKSNIFGNRCNSNIFGNTCYSNTFNNNCTFNIFGNNCYFNTFGNTCTSNTFGSGCNSNTFGNRCDYNTFGNGCYSNIFDDDCYSNTFGYYCTFNTFGNTCCSNTLGNNGYSNKFEVRCSFIKIQIDGICYIHVCKGVSNKTLTPEPKAKYEQIYRLSGSKEILV